jgi:hypothetical protein
MLTGLSATVFMVQGANHLQYVCFYSFIINKTLLRQLKYEPLILSKYSTVFRTQLLQYLETRNDQIWLQNTLMNL